MKNKLSLAVIAALCITSASAMQFQTLGYKSIAMGGAGVASSSGSVATYNNPALLAKAEYDVEISLGGGLSIQDHGAGASLQELDDIKFIDTVDAVNNDTTLLTNQSVRETLVSGANIIIAMDGNALEIAPHAYFSAQISGFGIGIFGSSDVVATAMVDQAHDRLIFEDSSTPGTYYEVVDANTISFTPTAAEYVNESVEYAVNNGLTYIKAEAIALAEVPVAYGHKFELSGGNVMIGGSLKYMQAVTYQENLRIDNSNDSTEEQLDKTSSSFGVDLGLAYEPSISNDLTLAVVAKNLNSPEFSFVDGSVVKIDPMIRAGIAYDIFESLEIAADMDLTKNKTFVSGAENQMVGGGLNFHPASWFAIRGGLMQNLDTNDQAGMIYTAGIGFGLKWLQVDLSAQMSSKSETVGDTTFPQYTKVNLALISRW
ncbi:conjugal transfer protein TraF [bacterium]|nr:conjugal transfer protein TraF [bacterium]MBU1989701.1 conjugal transfer protein TraF [bacterium]